MTAADAVNNTPAVLLLAGTFLTTVGGIIVAVISNRKVHRDNRNDHQETAAKVDRLLDGHTDIGRKVDGLAADVRGVKAAVRDLKTADRETDNRLNNLEHQRLRRI